MNFIKPRNKREANGKQSVPDLLHAGVCLGLFLDPEDGGDMIIRNFG
jgi:hypothetical protein